MATITLNIASFARAKTEKKLTALKRVDAFVSYDAGVRSERLKSDAPARATIRAQAIERSSGSRQGLSAALQLAMGGPPGREIRIVPSAPDIAETVARLLQQRGAQAES